MYPLLLLDHRQHVSGVDGYPGRDVKRYYRSGHWRFHLVLHLHSFDYDDAGSRIVAPMPGKVVRVLVEVGEQVEAGAGIVVVEAIKMKKEMKTPMAGTVVTLNVSAGITVNAGDVLAVIE